MNGEEVAAEAAQVLAQMTDGRAYEIALVLGSGWADSAETLGRPLVDVAASELPGFAASGVTGHAGRVRSVEVDGRGVLLFLGRTHLYEGRDPAAVAHAVRVAAA